MQDFWRGLAIVVFIWVAMLVLHSSCIGNPASSDGPQPDSVQCVFVLGYQPDTIAIESPVYIQDFTTEKGLLLRRLGQRDTLVLPAEDQIYISWDIPTWKTMTDTTVWIIFSPGNGGTWRVDSAVVTKISD